MIASQEYNNVSPNDIAFNNQLLNLLKELHRLYPNDSDIALLNKTVFLATTTCERKPRKMFKKYMKKYEKYIENRDETFFLTYEGYLSQMNATDWSLILIKKLKSMWLNMSLETHKSIWLYLNVLLKLTKRA
tara:strand:- start:2577 stop:2972 length:396 start_codon:yes stop_codon:yes gene_type:complete